MKVLVVGSGGREHAVIRKLSENKEITDSDIENTKNSYIKALKENNIIGKN